MKNFISHLTIFLVIQGLILVSSAQNGKKKLVRNKNIQNDRQPIDYEEYYDENSNGDEIVEEGKGLTQRINFFSNFTLFQFIQEEKIYVPLHKSTIYKVKHK